MKDTLGFPFRGEKPWTNLGLMAVAHIIPVIGPIIVLGYGVLVEKMFARDMDAPAPAFSFQNFSKYIERGIMPFLVQLVLSLPILMVVLPLTWGIMFLAIFLNVQEKGHPWVMVGSIAAAVLILMPAGLLAGVAMLPFTLRASLLGDFSASFDFRWAMDFLKRVGGQAVGAYFILQVVCFPIAIAGLLACYVGVFFAGSIITLMLWHLQIKLYHLYLDRGGTALAIRDETIDPAFPVVIGAAPPPVQPQ